MHVLGNVHILWDWVILWIIVTAAVGGISWMLGYDKGWDDGAEMERWFFDRDEYEDDLTENEDPEEDH